MLLSVVVPVYGCQGCLEELCRRLLSVGKTLRAADGGDVDMEIVLVDDASPDGAWERIVELARLEPRIKGLRMLRNFGQHFAITAGLGHAAGDYAAVMDCDLQDPPEELPKLWEVATRGHEVVWGRRAERRDSFGKRLASWTFYKLLSLLAGTKIDGAAANFSVISRTVVEGYLRLGERHRSYGLLVNWLFPHGARVDIAHHARTTGRSGYTLTRQLRLATDVVVSFSTRPLILSTFLGFACTAVSAGMVVWLMIKKIVYGVPVEGWASVMASVWLLGGLVLANLGVVGLYLGKVFEQSKDRPLYWLSASTDGRTSAELNPPTRPARSRHEEVPAETTP